MTNQWNKFYVSALRQNNTNWSTSVTALSFYDAVGKALKSHYDAGFAPISEQVTISVRNWGCTIDYNVDVTAKASKWSYTIKKGYPFHAKKNEKSKAI